MKGLDYALLAARKAELERQGEEVADEELEALLKDRAPGKRVKPETLKAVQTNGKKSKSDEALDSRVSHPCRLLK